MGEIARTDYPVSVFPNPAVNQLAVGGWQLAISNTEIYDAFGKLIFSQQQEANSQRLITIDVSDFAPGIYFIRMGDGKNFHQAKFVKM